MPEREKRRQEGQIALPNELNLAGEIYARRDIVLTIREQESNPKVYPAKICIYEGPKDRGEICFGYGSHIRTRNGGEEDIRYIYELAISVSLSGREEKFDTRASFASSLNGKGINHGFGLVCKFDTEEGLFKIAGDARYRFLSPPPYYVSLISTALDEPIVLVLFRRPFGEKGKGIAIAGHKDFAKPETQQALDRFIAQIKAEKR